MTVNYLRLLSGKLRSGFSLSNSVSLYKEENRMVKH